MHLSIASHKKSRDRLQLGLVQATVMITMHFIHLWTDWQLQIQRYSAGFDLHRGYLVIVYNQKFIAVYGKWNRIKNYMKYKFCLKKYPSFFSFLFILPEAIQNSNLGWYQKTLTHMQFGTKSGKTFLLLVILATLFLFYYRKSNIIESKNHYHIHIFKILTL